jgi:hypothetical protein
VASLVWVDRGSVYLSIGLIARLVLAKIGFFAAGPLGPRFLARRSRDRGVFLGVFRDLGVCGWVSWHRIAASFTAFFLSSLRRRNTIKDAAAKSHALFTKIGHGFVVFMDSLGFELVLP